MSHNMGLGYPSSKGDSSPSSDGDSSAITVIRNLEGIHGPKAGGMPDQDRPHYSVDLGRTIYPIVKRMFPAASVFVDSYRRQFHYGHPDFVKRQPLDLKTAISDGRGFVVHIQIPSDHDFQTMHPTQEWHELNFLPLLINVLHLLICTHNIGLDYAAIVDLGIKCSEYKREGSRYRVTVTFPTLSTAAVSGSIRCACMCEISSDLHLAKVDATCVLHGDLPVLQPQFVFQPTGNIAISACLGTVGYLSLLNLLKRVLEVGTREEETAFRLEMLHGSELKDNSTHIQSTGRAFAEAVVQCLAILNFIHPPVQHKVSRGDLGDVRVVVEVPLTEPRDERAVLIVKFNRKCASWNSGVLAAGGFRTKQTSRFNTGANLYPTFSDSTIVVTCPDWRHLDLPPARPLAIKCEFYKHPEDSTDEYAMRVKYIMKCLKDRELGCTESVVRNMIPMFRERNQMFGHAGSVQLLLGHVWLPQMAFPTQDKTLIAEMVEDTLRTCLVLFNGQFSPPKMHIMAKCSWPFAYPRSAFSMRSTAQCRGLDFSCNVNHDAAGNKILSISKGPIRGKGLFTASSESLGGIVLEAQRRDDEQIDTGHDESVEGDSGDDEEGVDGDGGEVEESDCGDDEQSGGDDDEGDCVDDERDDKESACDATEIGDKVIQK